MAHKLTHLSAVELARLVRTKKASPVEVVEAHLAAIERINPAVNAFCTVAAEKALAWAREAERAVKKRAKLRALHGVPVAIKDLTLTADIRTTFGSTLFRDHVPTEDAEVVRRLKAAGAIVLGKTNTPEFGAGANTVNKVFGATRNPWNTALSASGSTGGGAAALAARMAPLAEGTDFAGSLRTPAAFCGVVGLRTTAGLVPKHPAAMPWHDQSVAGPMARSAEDCALLLDAMTGLSGKSPLSAPAPWKSARDAVAKARSLRGLRLAYAPDIAGIGVDEEIERICRSAACGLRDAGAALEEIEFNLSDGRDAFLALRGEAMVGNHFDRLERIGELGDNLAGNIRAGLALTISGRGQEDAALHRLDRPDVPRVACGAAGGERARGTDGGGPAGRAADRRPEILRARDPHRGEIRRSGAPDRVAAELQLKRRVTRRSVGGRLHRVDRDPGEIAVGWGDGFDN